ncbi:hypothetical protein HMPREF7215_2570 [Pyramidobacter piscolens W5455]|uniref:Toxin-antitoxin system, antitoxin component, ribbon-helix-helix domain protein n=1 Tax=Pyramidobacter piscolens W5455 TaxID=352165 RepID=A0ABM9ZSG1_9BACT|nr:hypothetical protein HMPREF7215_2570 [Pyramidobacter piscolens W5455]
MTHPYISFSYMTRAEKERLSKLFLSARAQLEDIYCSPYTDSSCFALMMQRLLNNVDDVIDAFEEAEIAGE